ncbi:coiled-coil domain-containing protein 66 isoform X6 [Dromaius novaehollandiae]|uniref:coiled-coil domain-containing protein 66 isoform X6 n=1 Tax=Dromaius novaehollandiae TaxID=8790 RepID=UPI00311DBA76
MNLGDGLKLETEILDGKPRLILASYVGKSKPAVKMGNKARVPKHALRVRHTGHVSRSTQNDFIKHESLTDPRSESSLSMTKGEKLQITANSSSHEASTKDHSLIFQRDNTSRKLDSENLTVRKSKQKPQNPHTSAEDLRSSLVCLTQEQLEQILMTVKEGTRSLSEVHNEKQEEMAANEASEGNTIALFQKAGEVSSVPDEANSDSSRKQEAYPQPGQKVIKNSWKPADMFSTLGEREGDKALLEFKKSQWKKELDEQVALKKKLKETLEGEVGYFWKRPGSDKTFSEKMGTADPDKTVFPAHSVTTTDENCVCRTILTTEANEVPLSVSSGPAGQCCDFRSSDLPAVNYTALVLGEATLQEQPSSAGKHEQQKKWLEELDKQKEEAKLQKIEEKLNLSKIEERERRRQKQLEHQKAIMAQVEEKRKKKQLEEEQRKWEEQEEEQRLARERELMQKQFEEDLLKQKQKEELMTLKTNELYQTMQKAQELAQRLKQEQRIRDLAQKGHDISKLQKNLGGGDTVFENYNPSISHQSHNFSDDINSKVDQQTSPRKDTAVQTDDFNTSAYAESAEKRTVCCGSPDISIEYKETSNSKKCQKEMQYTDKNKIAEKENDDICSDLYEQFARKDRQVKPVEKCGKRPDWNINKPGKRYIPASERYPKQLQKQREENKVRRQMELLQLVERNTPGNLCQKKGSSSDRSPSPHQEMNRKNKGHAVRKGEQLHKNHLNEERSESAPVPAVKNRLHQGQQKQIHTSNFLALNNDSRREKSINTHTQQRSSPTPVTEPGRPPSSHFIPYVRTNEVYYLDPDAPVTRPSTHDPQYQQFNDSYPTSRQIFSSDHVRDPLLNPDVVKIRERQQAILKGLSELRQGLLQKQKELETGLIPAVAQEENFISPF